MAGTEADGGEAGVHANEVVVVVGDAKLAGVLTSIVVAMAD